eukprot:TRINITY_DN42826_c0_g1_i1.p1 TRINITY_DN42826_c0_g1~~TRINITY_DN42826_c0_g1_i1.p1  ORF type:complete len:515 (+),score=92.64 TRINITY_DN42826_c0_g1_i1:66-1610(+)
MTDRFTEVVAGSGHWALHPDSDDAKAIAAAQLWYGPKFSPKDVPSFFDVSSLTEDPSSFQRITKIFVERYKAQGEKGPTHVLGYDARGFIIGPPVALALGIPFVLFRKDAKNPGVVVESSGYAKEYVEKKLDNMCFRIGSIPPGARVLLIDDLIATGGTALAGFELCMSLDIEVAEFAAVIDLPVCEGVRKIREYAGGRFKDTPIFTLIDGKTVPQENCRDPSTWGEEGRFIPAPRGKEIIAKYPGLAATMPPVRSCDDDIMSCLREDPVFVELVPGSGHFVLETSCEDAKFLAGRILWYGPKFSPKDVPKFYDVSSVTEDVSVFRKVTDIFVARYRGMGSSMPSHVLAYDARGFLLGAPIALALGIPFVLFRKDGKNPGVVVESSGYAKEYVEKKLDNMCFRIGAIPPGSRVLLIDDLIATGGTALAGFELCMSLDIEICEFAALIDLPFCEGVKKIREYAGGRFKDTPIFTVIDGSMVPDENCRDPKAWEEESRIIAAPRGKDVMAKYASLA